MKISAQESKELINLHRYSYKHALTGLTALIFLASLTCLFSCDLGRNKDILLENSNLQIRLDRKTGALVQFRDQAVGYDYLAPMAQAGSFWEIEILTRSGLETIGLHDAGTFGLQWPDSRSIELTWKRFRDIDNRKFSVTVEIALDERKTISRWNIRYDNADHMDVRSISFPKIAGIREMKNEHLAVPLWMGEVQPQPREHLADKQPDRRNYTWDYPGQLSLQCLALYNPNTNGFYAACEDTLAYTKKFSLRLDSLNRLTCLINHTLSLDSTRTDFSLPYNITLGSFKGDWMTAAFIYRDWASQQPWCKKSRLKRGKNPAWLEETALWIWNRGKSPGVIPHAIDLKQRLGLPVNVFWHWWHGCAYDIGFPEYFPPREGKNSFMRAMESAHDEGVHAIVYMNALQWGTSTQSWITEKAEPHAVKDEKGNLRSHVYNKFTGKSLTNMCITTDFWKDKYAALSDSAVNIYRTDGIYMDQACLTRLCYDADHGHPTGGGNYWVPNFGQLTTAIRQKTADARTVLAGEGGGEAWIPHLDAFLTLQVSKERYSGTGSWVPVPFYQAVYHEYALTYGSYSSLLSPPYDPLWPSEHAPKDTLQLLDARFNKQFLMEQARSFIWGMQPMIANYQSHLADTRKEEIRFVTDMARVRYHALKYLLHGKFMRPPHINIPKEVIPMSKLSIYAGRTGETVTTYQQEVPLVYAGAWLSADKHFGIALSNIGDEPYSTNIHFNSSTYDLAHSGGIYMIGPTGRQFHSNYSQGQVIVRFDMEPRSTILLEIVPESL